LLREKGHISGLCLAGVVQGTDPGGDAEDRPAGVAEGQRSGVSEGMSDVEVRNISGL